MWRARTVLGGVGGRVDQLQDQRATRHDARATRQEVAADNVLEHRRLASRLAADDDDLRQADLDLVADDVEDILQLVDDWDQLIEAGARGIGRRRWCRE